MKQWFARCAGLAAFAMGILAPGLADAEGLSASAAVSASPAFSVDDFARWSDATFGEAYASQHAFSGMGLVVVRDGRTVLTRTYGLARHSPDQAIDPASTRFLIGSLTKTFTGLAIAQLVDKGKIHSIDDPANLYLKRVQLEGDRGRRITIRQLLTHSAGFGFTNRDVGTDHLIGTPVSRAEIIRLSPGIAREPGEIVSYSNYSAGLLGIMVEDIGGLPVETYLHRNIWQPLGMSSAVLQKSLTLNPGTAEAYQWTKGAWTPKPFIALHPFNWPVGAIEFSLTDAARYAAFELSAARGGDPGILTVARHAQLRSKLRASDPRIGGFGFQMMAFDWNGRQLFGHGGTWPGYESMLIVSPADNLAIFYSIVGPDKIGNLQANQLLLKHLYGGYRPARPPAPLGASRLREYAGLYRPTMRPQGSIEAVMSFMGPGDGVHVSAKDGGLMIGGDGPFLQVGRDLFWKGDAAFTGANPFAAPQFAFVRAPDGRVKYMVQHFGLTPQEKVPAWQDPKLRTDLLTYLSFGLLTGLAAVFWPRRGRGDLVIMAAAVLCAPTLLAITPALMAGFGPRGLEAYLLEGQDGRFIAVNVLANIAGICALVLVAAAAAFWTQSASRPLWVRLHLTALALAAAGAATILATMNALGLVRI